MGWRVKFGHSKSDEGGFCPRISISLVWAPSTGRASYSLSGLDVMKIRVEMMAIRMAKTHRMEGEMSLRRDSSLEEGSVEFHIDCAN